MTTDEIKDLIASKIAGQGSAVDAGSALPEILNGIVDALEESGIIEITEPGLAYGVQISEERASQIMSATAVKCGNYIYHQAPPIVLAQYKTMQNNSPLTAACAHYLESVAQNWGGVFLSVFLCYPIMEVYYDEFPNIGEFSIIAVLRDGENINNKYLIKIES